MKVVRGVAIGVLGFLGVSAIAGALPLILDPSGGLMHMPRSMLRHSPFHTFLIPGLILLLANGLLSLLVLTAVLRRRPGYGWWVAFQGCVATGWIVVEVAMVGGLDWLQFLYLTVGLALMASGGALTRESRAA